jgi:hypothetical protein
LIHSYIRFVIVPVPVHFKVFTWTCSWLGCMWSQPLSRLQFNLQAMHFLGFTLEDCRAQLSSSSTLILWWCVVWWWETTSELRNKLAPKKTPMDWLLHLPSWHNYRWVFGDLILEITRSQSVSWIAESPSSL